MAQNLSQSARRAVRKAAGLSGRNYPIVVVAGVSAPRLAGEGYYWTTPSGKTIVHHPSAYGWRTLYHASTYGIAVGARWLARRGLLSVVSASDPTILVSPIPVAA